MTRLKLLLCAVAIGLAPVAWAYIEAPYTLGRCIAESTNAVLVEVKAVDREKNLIVFKKLRDIKGQHPDALIKHNIGKRGQPRDWQTVMAWAKPGQKAVVFHNGMASETCVGSSWYQCFREGDWWGMSHVEPMMLRTYFGDPAKLADAVAAVLEGKEVGIPCLIDGPREHLQLGKGKLHILKTSLKRQDYNPKRDFVAAGGAAGGAVGDNAPVKTYRVLSEGSAGWKFVPARRVQPLGDRWAAPDFDDAKWATGKAPVGYGEADIAKRGGTKVSQSGEAFAFRHEFNVPADVLGQKGIAFRLAVASDDSATVYLNGAVVDRDPSADHEFAYWNREVALKPEQFRAGRNVVAALVKNGAASSDLYLDVEIAALVPLPSAIAVNAAPARPGTAKAGAARSHVLPAETLPTELVVDKAKRTVSLPCTIAPRQVPTLKAKYPIEVIATYPHPKGQKAHETVVTFQGIRPSMVHRALMDLGLSAGTPARGESQRPTGPTLEVFLEWTVAGKSKRLPLEQVLLDTRTGKSPPAFAWHFTGSAFSQPDPEKDEYVYGANLTGTLMTIYPVTDEAVVQSAVPSGAESTWRLETNPKVLPQEGASARLVLRAK